MQPSNIIFTCAGNTKGGKYSCTVDLLFDWFGISCMTIYYFCFYLQNWLIQTSQTGGQRYSDTSTLSIPWHVLLLHLAFATFLWKLPKRLNVQCNFLAHCHLADWLLADCRGTKNYWGPEKVFFYRNEMFFKALTFFFVKAADMINLLISDTSIFCSNRTTKETKCTLNFKFSICGSKQTSLVLRVQNINRHSYDSTEIVQLG